MVNRMGFGLIRAVKDKNTDTAKILLSQGADANICVNGVTPLLLASGYNDVEMCQILLSHGADPNMRSFSMDTTPLITAASYGHCKIVQLLVEAGADTELKDSDGLNSHYWAFKSSCKSCCNFLKLKRVEKNGFKKVHFSESLGSLTESSLSSCTDKERKRSSISSSIQLTPRELEKLKLLLSIEEKFTGWNLNSRIYFEGLFKNKQISSSANNLTANSNSNQSLLTPKSQSSNAIYDPLPKSTDDQKHSTRSPVISTTYHSGSDANISIYYHPNRFFDNISLRSSIHTVHNTSRNTSIDCSNILIETKNSEQLAVMGDDCALSGSIPMYSNEGDNDERQTFLSFSPCDILDTAFRHSVEPMQSNQKYSFKSDDDGDDNNAKLVKTMDMAFCETFSASLTLSDCEIRKMTKEERRYVNTEPSNTVAQSEPQCPPSDIFHIPLEDKQKSDWSFDQILSEVKEMRDDELRSKLTSFKVIPGPILNSTRRTYQLRLAKLLALRKSGVDNTLKDKTFDPSVEIIHICSDSFEESFLDELETDMSRPFMNADPTATWRQGTKKSCFNYLLLDPRISRNLPKRVKVLGKKKGFLVFVESIFYVGKGQRARPYEHLKEAVIQRSKLIVKKPSKKVAKIIEIWKSGMGVVSLCTFQNTMAAESLTREACMIEAIGLKNLTNIYRGQMYGPSSKWPQKDVRRLGAWLLWKSFIILLNEGERQIMFGDINESGVA